MQPGGIGISTTSRDRGIAIRRRQGREWDQSQTHLRHQAGAQVAVEALSCSPDRIFLPVSSVSSRLLCAPDRCFVGKPLEGLNGPQTLKRRDDRLSSEP